MATTSIHLNGRAVLVDVFVTVYGEDLETVKRTVRAAVAMRGAHRTWVLDDGRSDAVKDAAAELGAWYIRRLSSNGAKAGNLNHAMSVAKGDFFAVFDADFVPDPRVPRGDGPVLREPECRVRADAAGVWQPPHRHRARRGLHADGVLPVRAARPQSLQRGLLRRHERHLPARPPSTTSAASTPIRSPKTCGRRSACTSAGGVRSTSPTSSPSGTPPRRSRPTASSSCAGRPAGSRSSSPTIP